MNFHEYTLLVFNRVLFINSIALAVVEGVDQSEADVELLGWEECAENMSFRVDKAWRQRCSQRFVRRSIQNIYNIDNI